MELHTMHTLCWHQMKSRFYWLRWNDFAYYRSFHEQCYYASEQGQWLLFIQMDSEGIPLLPPPLPLPLPSSQLYAKSSEKEVAEMGEAGNGAAGPTGTVKSPYPQRKDIIYQ